jgi:hypothetical protein
MLGIPAASVSSTSISSAIVPKVQPELITKILLPNGLVPATRTGLKELDLSVHAAGLLGEGGVFF